MRAASALLRQGNKQQRADSARKHAARDHMGRLPTHREGSRDHFRARQLVMDHRIGSRHCGKRVDHLRALTMPHLRAVECVDVLQRR